MLSNDIKDSILDASKRELQRATNYVNVTPRWPVLAANVTALLLYLRRQYSDAEEVLRQAVRVVDKAAARSVPDSELVLNRIHQATNLLGKGSLFEAEHVCQVPGNSSIEV